ncbi:MAG: ArnT family glycosyltransferase [Myxococcota bacterium]
MLRAAPAFGRQQAILLGALLAFGGLVRALAWKHTEVLFNDGPVFLAMAEAWQSGRFAEVLAHPYHPLYPILIAWLAPLSGGPEAAGVALSILGGLLAVFAVFVFAWNAFGREVAWASGWVLCLHPWAVDFSADVMSDGVYAGLYLSGFAALCATLKRPRWTSAVLCGVFAALAYGVRPEGVGLLILAVGMLGWTAWRMPTTRGASIKAIGILAFVAIVVSLPFLNAQQAENGVPSLSSKKSVEQLIAGGPTEAERAEDRRARRQARSLAAQEGRALLPLPESAIRSDGRPERLPARTLGGAAESVTRVARTSAAAFRYELLVFAVLGAALMRSEWRRDREGAILGAVTLYSAVLILLVWGAGYVGRRHALTATLPAIPLAVAGWFGLCRRVHSRYFPKQEGAFRAQSATIVLVVLLLLAWGPRDLRSRRSDRAPTRAAAEWLAENHPSSGAVAAQKLRTAYYAEATFVPLPPGHDGLMQQQLTRRRTRWVVIDTGKLDDHLGLRAGIGDWLQLRHEELGEGRRVLVLEITPEPASSL